MPHPPRGKGWPETNSESITKETLILDERVIVEGDQLEEQRLRGDGVL